MVYGVANNILEAGKSPYLVSDKICRFMRYAAIKKVDHFVDEHGNLVLIGCQLTEANFKGANMKGADLKLAQLYHAKFTRANLRGANLRGAIIRKSDLISEKFKNTLLPTNYKEVMDIIDD